MRFEPEYATPEKVHIEMTAEEARIVERALALLRASDYLLVCLEKGLADALSGHRSDR